MTPKISHRPHEIKKIIKKGKKNNETKWERKKSVIICTFKLYAEGPPDNNKNNTLRLQVGPSQPAGQEHR
jgi:hypothetical protein